MFSSFLLISFLSTWRPHFIAPCKNWSAEDFSFSCVCVHVLLSVSFSSLKHSFVLGATFSIPTFVPWVLCKFPTTIGLWPFRWNVWENWGAHLFPKFLFSWSLGICPLLWKLFYSLLIYLICTSV